MTKVALVTGGTRGIGLEISKALAEDGYEVAALYHGNEEGAKIFKDATGGMAVKADVADLAACQAAVEKIEKKLGGISVLVNNAGITKDGMLHKMSA